MGQGQDGFQDGFGVAAIGEDPRGRRKTLPAFGHLQRVAGATRDIDNDGAWGSTGNWLPVFRRNRRKSNGFRQFEMCE
jgi:hypothetical protein